MASDDGLLARVKPRVGGLTSAQARSVAAAAAAHGSGRIEVTNRANLQIRGLSAASAPLFAQAMVDAGLASPDPASERRRNILLSIDADDSATAMAMEIEQWLESDASLAALPGKFGFGVGTVDGHEPAADIRVRFDAGMPALSIAGAELRAPSEQPLAAVRALTHAFLRLSGAMTPVPGRMKSLVAAVGAPAVLAEAGLRVGVYDPPAGLPSPAPAVSGVFSLGLPFGAADAELLRAAANLAERFGNGRIRTTSSRALALMDVREDTSELASVASQAGFIVRADDPRLNMVACAGRPACPNAAADVRAAAGRLAEVWRESGSSVGGVLHVSGCAKGCAHPGAARVTLVATAGGGYDMILDGRPGDSPRYPGLSLDEAAQIIAERGVGPA
jgi:precorrin-3B synthase